MSQRGLPHTAVWSQISELLAESSKSVPDPGVSLLVHCASSVALGAGVGLLVGDLFPGMAGCRAGVTSVAVVCLLVCGAGSWVLWLQGPGSPRVRVLGHRWLGLGPGHTRAGAYPLMGKTGPRAMACCGKELGPRGL